MNERETPTLLVRYPPVTPAALAECSAIARRAGFNPQVTEHERLADAVAAGGDFVLAAFERAHTLWLCCTDLATLTRFSDDRRSPAPGFDDLIQAGAEMFCLPRDLIQLETRLASQRVGPAELPAKEMDEWLTACGRIGLVGRSPLFRRMLGMLARLSRYDVPVLLEGDTGTGKELCARALHYLGPRSARPFVPINCGALTDTLLESELFGHVRGAFTDARTASRGLVAQAEGGTLFFDEVHCLSPKGQVTLLRFMQDHVYRPVGGDAPSRADVRIVAATNLSLAQEVEQGRFREDLLYRLNVTSVHLPSLNQRSDDIPLLIDNAVARLCARFRTGPRRFDAESLAWASRQPWRGNIRELENFVCREFLLSDDPLIRADPARGDAAHDDGAHDHGAHCSAALSFHDARARMLAKFESQYLRSALAQTNGNVTAAARIAGKERRVFGRLMKKHGIGRGEFSGP